MKLYEARQWVRQFATNAGESNYTPEKIDRAIQHVGGRWCRITKAVKTTSTVALTAGNPVADLAALTAAGFGTYRIYTQYLASGGSGEELVTVGYGAIQRNLAQYPTSGVPTMLAFRDNAYAKVYPIPDVNYTVEIRWWQPFTAWVAGLNDAGAQALDLNIPDAALQEILPFGPPAVLQHNEPEKAYASATWQRYLAIEQEHKLFGSSGVQVVDRARGLGRAFGAGPAASGRRYVDPYNMP